MVATGHLQELCVQGGLVSLWPWGRSQSSSGGSCRGDVALTMVLPDTAWALSESSLLDGREALGHWPEAPAPGSQASVTWGACGLPRLLSPGPCPRPSGTRTWEGAEGRLLPW